MIENLTFSETVESYTTQYDANILLAKSIIIILDICPFKYLETTTA